jgi:hypothetical protein
MAGVFFAYYFHTIDATIAITSLNKHANENKSQFHPIPR